MERQYANVLVESRSSIFSRDDKNDGIAYLFVLVLVVKYNTYIILLLAVGMAQPTLTGQIRNAAKSTAKGGGVSGDQIFTTKA